MAKIMLAQHKLQLKGFTPPSKNMDPPHALYILQLQIAYDQFCFTLYYESIRLTFSNSM